jgi:uncharacterized membrane protein
MSMDKLHLAVKLVAVAGILLALYIIYQQVYQPPFEICNISSTVNCDAIISGPLSKTLGLPTSLYALIGYTVIFFASAFKKTKLMLGMATFGLLFCLYIGYRELFELKVLCPLCIGCHVTMITTFTLSLITYNREKK